MRWLWRHRVGIGLFLVVLAYCVYSSFGVLHPVLWGHYGHHAAEYLMRARMSLRFHLLLPATEAGFAPPAPSHYYLHHPIGYHHLFTLLIALFGDRSWLAAVAPAVTGLFTLWALYALVSRFWSAAAGLLATAVFVALPILCSFSILTDAMLPALAFSLVFVRAHLEHLEAPSPRWLAIAAVALVMGGLLAWEPFLVWLLVSIHALLLLATPSGRAARLGRWPAAAVWLLATSVAAALVLGFHFALVRRYGLGADLAESFRQRHHPIAFAVLRAQLGRWLGLLYGWPPLAIGVGWLVRAAVRLVTRRAQRRDLVPLLFLAVNTIYVALFPEGVLVHLYRVFWLSGFFAIAAADLACELHGKLASRWPARATALTLVPVAAYFALVTPHALHNLVESREMMGTHGQPGYDPEREKHLFAMEVAARTGPSDLVVLHHDLPRRLEFFYYVDRTHVEIPTLAELPSAIRNHPRAVLLIDAWPEPSERKRLDELLSSHPAQRFGRYLLVDLRAAGPELVEYRFEPERPSRWWWWFVSHKYPPVRLREVTTSYPLCVAAATGMRLTRHEVPEPPPFDLAAQVCYQNFLLARGRPDLASRHREQLGLRALGRGVPLGSGELLALRPDDAGRLSAWLFFAHPAAPGALMWRFTAGARTFAHAGAPVVERPDVTPGRLYAERLSVPDAPGSYELAVEIGGETFPVGSVEISSRGADVRLR